MNDTTFLEFPKGWSGLKDQPLPEAPKNSLEFLNSVKVSQEELEKGRPVAKKFVIPQKYLSQ